MFMKRTVTMLALLAALWTSGATPPARSRPTDRALMIAPSSAPVASGKATLTIGPLRRTGDIFAGDYQVKVAPYFFKSEKGKLAIEVPAESLAKVINGKSAEITGTATTNGKGERKRRIDATATPADGNRGALKLWFVSGGRKMVFNTSYQFVEK
jgi:hypothetical protein